MARLLSNSVLVPRRGSLLPHRSSSSSFLRHFSTKPQLIEIDLDSSSSAINKMEEIMHSILVKKSTPDWLPFLPGSSFWVPLPRRGPNRTAHLIDKLTNRLTTDESLSLTTARGWPCSSFFVPDVSRMDIMKVKFPEEAEDGEEVKVEVFIDPGKKSS